MPLTSAEKVRAYRARQKQKGEPDSTRTHAATHKRENSRAAYLDGFSHLKPFVGCDGEGCGTDSLGRQLYMLFRMGDRELFTGQPLSTWDILDFICDADAASILVGFSFGYDVTMILRDLPERQLRKLFEPKEEGEGRSRYVWYKDFDIEYLPKQYFRVRRAETIRTPEGEKRKGIEGSGRTIYETFGFFQSSFIKACKNFETGTEDERQRIAENKARRSDFTEIDQEERDYCELECIHLAELMAKLREYCYAANIRPHTWNGAGKLASALHSAHETISANEVKKLVPAEVRDLANMAYYGGRFEITRTGMISSPVYGYDIRSAYPDAMRKLPCLEHGRWTKANAASLKQASDRGALYVAGVTFNHPDKAHGQLCGFPVRSKQGHLYWPLQGGGIYWSPEIEAAKLLGATVRYKEGWVYERRCQCEVFEWIEPLYDYRQSIGSSGPGYPIKLGINSLYGKLAQRIGNGRFGNMVWAGLITALTRAKLIEGIAEAPDSIIMVATDGIYSLKPLNLPQGVRLGQWEHEQLDGLFVVQPGLYWCPEKRKRKSRGLSGKFFEEEGRTEGFEHRWKAWTNEGGAFPEVSVPVTNFIGLKLALSWGKPERAGCWDQVERTIRFDYSNKREGHILADGHIVTSPKPGRPGLVSLPHRDFLAAGGHEPWEQARSMLEDQRDYIDLSPPTWE